MAARSLALLAVVLLASAPSVEARDTEPTRAGREGRAELDALMAKQHLAKQHLAKQHLAKQHLAGQGRDRGIRAARPKPTDAEPVDAKPRRDRSPAGKTLPAICVGCGANRTTLPNDTVSG